MHCLDFEIFLILGSATQPKNLRISDQRIVCRDSFHVGGVCSLSQNQARKTYVLVCRREESVRVF